MKIGLVILHADPARGGAERSTIDIAHALAARGHDVTILAADFSEQIARHIRQVKLEIAGPSKTWRYVQFLSHLDHHLLTHHFDVIHAMLPVRMCDVYHPHAGIAAAVEEAHEKHTGAARSIAKLFNRVNLKRQRFATVERELLERANRPLILCLSNYIRQTVKEYYSPADDDLVTLFNAVDLKKFDPLIRPGQRENKRAELELRPEDIAALIVAQDFERKGLREAILAMVRVKNPNLRLIVVGRDSTKPYEKLAREWSMLPGIRFAGPTRDVVSHYQAADFFVLPTKHDPCSLVVLEALSMGLPVISTKQNGATEIMQSGTHGFVLDDPARVDLLAAAMEKLCDPVVRSSMRAACLKLRPKLAFDRHIEQLLKIYLKAQARRTRPIEEA